MSDRQDELVIELSVKEVYGLFRLFGKCPRDEKAFSMSLVLGHNLVRYIEL